MNSIGKITHVTVTSHGAALQLKPKDAGFDARLITIQEYNDLLASIGGTKPEDLIGYELLVEYTLQKP